MQVKFSNSLATVLLAALVLGGGCGCGESGRKREREARAEVITDEIKALLREGDIVFRRGHGITSRAVLAADPEGAYSHVGVVAAGGMIVHIVPGEPDPAGVEDVVKADTPEAFFAPARALEGAVMRVSGDSISVARTGPVRMIEVEVANGNAAMVAVGELMAEVSRHAVAMAATGLKFDHDYDLADTTRMYCTELVWHIFGGAGLDLTDGRRSHINLPGFRGDYILPTDIQNDPRLELIYRF